MRLVKYIEILHPGIDNPLFASYRGPSYKEKIYEWHPEFRDILNRINIKTYGFDVKYEFYELTEPTKD